MAEIDHVILKVNDIQASLDFYVSVLGFEPEGSDGPFTVVRVCENFILQLAPWGTVGSEHFAFAMSREDFDKTFTVLKEKNIPYGDSFHTVGTNTGPGFETGAKGPAPTLYMFDPNKHLIEIRTYD